MYSKESIFASGEWCTVPFLFKKKTTSDWLNDILLKIPECMGLRLELKELRTSGSLSAEPLMNLLKSKAQWLLIRFQEYWKERGDEIDPNYTWEGYREVSDFQNSSEEWVAYCRPIYFHNKFAARIIAEFDAGNAIVYSILREVCMDKPPGYKQSVFVHCASILEAVHFLDSLGVDSGGNTSLVFPLKTISQCTPSREQETQSRIELEKWGKTRGVEGVSKMLKNTL